MTTITQTDQMNTHDFDDLPNTLELLRFRHIATQAVRLGGYWFNTGDEYWLNHDGKFHREDGPAIITAAGWELWMNNGNLHRTDGPAVINDFGVKEYWENGVKLADRDSA